MKNQIWTPAECPLCRTGEQFEDVAGFKTHFHLEGDNFPVALCEPLHVFYV